MGSGEKVRHRWTLCHSDRLKLAPGREFKGLLFTGIMLTRSGAKVLEHNPRFGDPETQAIIPLLESDLGEVLLACTQKRLHEVEVRFSQDFACNVVVAAGGYPDAYRRGDLVELGSPPESM